MNRTEGEVAFSMDSHNQGSKTLIDILAELTGSEAQGRLSPEMLIGILSLLNLLSILNLITPQNQLQGPLRPASLPSTPDLRDLADLMGRLAGKSGEAKPELAPFMNFLGSQLSQMGPNLLPALLSMFASQAKQRPVEEGQAQEIGPGQKANSKGGAREGGP